MTIPITSFPEIQWPAIPSPLAAGIFAALFQLEQTQHWSPAQLATAQSRQLKEVLRHSYEAVPFYRQRFDALKLTVETAHLPDAFRQIPVLTRRDIQTAGESLYATQVPPTHGNIASSMTSGSTGQPVVVRTTALTQFFWRVLTLRDHYWHRRDFSQPFAAIRYRGDNQGLPPFGMEAGNWGSATESMIPTGPAFLLNVLSTIDEQVDWLRNVNPGYVLSYPSVLLAIAQRFAERGWSLPNLQEVRTFGEILEARCRASLRKLFGAKVVDMYSAQEVGYIALQCPEHDHYHIQSESVLVEVLNDAGQACKPAQIGRVVVTTLHNFAMPLVRYDIGDYAEVGGPCPCGRGLPVLKRIFGRQRNLLALPNGERRWPLFAEGEGLESLPSVYQFQVVQRSLEDIEVNFVRDASFTDEEQTRVKRYFQQTLGYPFQITLNHAAVIPRSRTGKFEDFISHVQ